jgi:hypothetical protein
MDKKIEQLKEVFNHCVKMAQATAKEHKLMAQRFYGRAEGLLAAIELLRDDKCNLLTKLLGR